MRHSTIQEPLFDTPRVCRFCGQERPSGDFVTVGQKSGRCSECRIKHRRERQNKTNKRTNTIIKIEVLQHYGNGTCAYCGERSTDKLNIDHMDGQGKRHREHMKANGMSLGTGNQLYYWLRRTGYPEGYQVLCRHCNHAKNNLSDEQFRQWVALVYERLFKDTLPQ
jgi:5-methylcytosine-specific restriction endonuclease McrA